MRESICSSPPFRIAIVGGGQLGKMMTVAAKQFGFHVSVLDPTPDSPAAQVADCQTVASFHDRGAIRRLAEEADVLTYEFEHIDCTALTELEGAGFPVFPSARLLRVIQHKLAQKQALQAARIPVPQFMAVGGETDVRKAAEQFSYPLLLKACTGGYDGKGNYLLRSLEEIGQALPVLGETELMAEKYVPFVREISVLAARGLDGEVKTYPLSENEHQDNILRRSIVPARVGPAVAKRAREVAEAVMMEFAGVGVFCVEMFVTAKEEVLVNEVAPRPHNSGHYTIEACVTSQFEQHIRAIAGLPLGDCALRSPAVMVNLLGADGQRGPAVLEGCGQAMALPGVHLHYYGKARTAPLRKMGHFTVTAADLEQALAVAGQAQQMLRVVAAGEGEENNE